MRKGIFSTLAIQNIRNNKSTYIPYMITCIFCIAMIYMMDFFVTARHLIRSSAMLPKSA